LRQDRHFSAASSFQIGVSRGRRMASSGRLWSARRASVLCLAQGEKLMPVGMFRSEEGWVQVDYGTGNIPIPRSKYEENKYKPDFDKLPTEAEYWAAEKKKDDARGS
jgi:hypothetical protein